MTAASSVPGGRRLPLVVTVTDLRAQNIRPSPGSPRLAPL